MLSFLQQYFQIDFWVLWGLLAQSLFFARLVIQWILSEKAHKTIIPISFWWLGILGALMLLIYAIARHDFVFLITALLQIFIYSRNIIIATS